MIKRGKAEKWAARSERLSAALRQNLKRRKEQARGRATDSNPLGDDAQEMPPTETQTAEPQKHRGEAGLAPPDTAADTATPDFRRIPGGNSPGGVGGTKTPNGG